MSEHPKEVTVVIKGTDSTYRQKFLVYEEFMVEPGSPVLKSLILDAQEAYKGEVEEIKIRVAMQWL